MQFSKMRFSENVLVEAFAAPKFGAELPALTGLLTTVPPLGRPRSILITHVLDTAVAYVINRVRVSYIRNKSCLIFIEKEVGTFQPINIR